MTNNYELADHEIRSRRSAPSIPGARSVKRTPPPRPFDAVAYAAALEVLG